MSPALTDPAQISTTPAPLDWHAPRLPDVILLQGERVSLRPVEPASDAGGLYAATGGPQADPDQWTYLFDGPFADAGSLEDYLERCCVRTDRQTLCIVDNLTQQPVGLAAYMNLTPAYGVIELGNLAFGRPMQRTPAATETIYLMAQHAFDLGYRRVEWKCNDRNERSKRAAKRFGFVSEGLFRQHMLDKFGQNRDTAWFSMLDSEWPRQKAVFECWLRKENFDTNGIQPYSIEQIRQGSTDNNVTITGNENEQDKLF